MGNFPVLDPDEDDGTMPLNAATFEEAIVGHRIVSVQRTLGPGRFKWDGEVDQLQLTLDNGRTVLLYDTGDCCAFTELLDVVEHLPTLDHVITSVSCEEEYTKWFILCDLGPVLELTVAWSAGNPFYYAYGFGIEVLDVE